MSERPLVTGGYLLYFKNGEDFCKVGEIESVEPIDLDKEYKYETERQFVNIIGLPTEVSCAFQFKEKQWKKLEKALGIYKYTFKKIKKGKRIVRILI